MAESPVTLKKDGGMSVYAAPVADTALDGSSIRIPQVSTTMGADFGETITDDNRYFAAKREPIAGFLIYGIAKAITEKWFTINDITTKKPDTELDRVIQKELKLLKYKSVLTDFVIYKRLYGNTLLVGSFDDAQQLQDLMQPRKESASLKLLTVIPRINYSVVSYDKEPLSPRFGMPLIYQVTNGNLKSDNNQSATYQLHWTRCFEHVGDSVLDLIWDDLTCGRNIRWGVGQWVFRTGGGFAVIKFPKEINGKPTTKAQLTEWMNAKEWSDITHRTYIGILNEVMDFEFKGASGAAMNPEPFFDTNTKQIAKATGYPKSILEGAEAGALTGSEKNDQQFYKQISGEQEALEDVNRWVIDQIPSMRRVPVASLDSAPKSYGSTLRRLLHRVAPSLAVDKDAEQSAVEYEIVWNSAFELSALDEARVELTHEQANVSKLQYMTVDEVRARVDDELKPLPNKEGEVVLSLKAPVSPFGANPNDPNNQQQGNNNQNKPPQEDPDMTQPQDSAIPSLKILLGPIIKKVYNGTLTHDAALSQGYALIDFYNDSEKERALNYTRVKFNNATQFLSPEQEQEFADQDARFKKDFLAILTQTEKIAGQQVNA
jgi:phage-related protein (TIGR01555 family)